MMPGTHLDRALPPNPKVSVVIITRNEGSELQATVTNVLETAPADRTEVIVVDDGSGDGSTAFLTEFPEVRVLRSDGIGVARARNFGADHATGDVILFADAHVRAPNGWHEPICEALRDECVGSVAPGICSTTAPARCGYGLDLTGPNLHTTWRRKKSDLPQAVPVLPGCFLAMRREVYRRTGGYDGEMRQLGGNDAELSCRFWLLGYRQLVLPEIVVSHLFRTATPYPSHWTSVVHNRLRMAFVHFGRERLERVLLALRPYEAFPAAMALIRDANIFSRRAEVLGARQFDDDWYFQQFTLTC
jgi:glycosyltransferase involved in cell wall biosynthesis